MATRPPRAARPRATAADLDARMLHMERSVSEQLLELRHGQQSHGTAIASIQSDMHKLVAIAEKQIELAHESKEQSRGLDRAFATLDKNRAELLEVLTQTRIEQTEAIREVAKAFERWREDHERENAAVSKTVTRHQTGVVILWAMFALVLMLVGGWATVEKQRIEEKIMSKEQAATEKFNTHLLTSAATERRLESRLERLEAERDRENR